MAESALFYYWAHELEELYTPTSKGLVDKVDTIFLEFVAPELEPLDEIEMFWNKSIAEGELVGKAKEFTTDRIAYYFFELIKGNGKRFVFERSLEADFDVNEEDNRSSRAFFDYPLNTALTIKEEYLSKNEAYQIKRENSVVEQIMAIPGSVLVSFGVGHPKLAEQVASHRPVETHFPYPGYPLSYETLMHHDFRETGKIDKVLYLRCMMDQMARKALMEKMWGRDLDLSCHHYASILTPEQIEDYRDYCVNCSKFSLVTLSGWSSMPKIDIFESFLRKEGLPLVEEIRELVNNPSD